MNEERKHITTTNFVNAAPSEILLDIISFVDKNSIFKTRLVCRRFEKVMRASRKVLPLPYHLYRLRIRFAGNCVLLTTAAATHELPYEKNSYGRFLECLEYVHTNDLHFKFDRDLPDDLVAEIVSELRLVHQNNPDVWDTTACIGWIPSLAVKPLLTDVLFCRSLRFRKKDVVDEIGRVHEPLLNLPALRNAHRIALRDSSGWRQSADELFAWLHLKSGREFNGGLMDEPSKDELFKMLVEDFERATESHYYDLNMRNEKGFDLGRKYNGTGGACWRDAYHNETTKEILNFFDSSDDYSFQRCRYLDFADGWGSEDESSAEDSEEEEDDEDIVDDL